MPKTPLQRRKQLARTSFHEAIKEGKIVRSDECSSCGKKCKPDGHHDDYNKPLEVIWVCKPCHAAKHRLVITNLLKAAEELISEATPAMKKKWQSVIYKAKIRYDDKLINVLKSKDPDKRLLGEVSNLSNLRGRQISKKK